MASRFGDGAKKRHRFFPPSPKLPKGVNYGFYKKI